MSDLFHRLTRNPQYKLLSLLIAVLAWVYVQGERVHEANLKAEIVWTLPPALMTIDPLPETINVRVLGTRTATARAQESLISIPIDLANLGVGSERVDFSNHPPVELPPGVEIMNFQPRTLQIQLDEISTRKVQVRPSLVGDPIAGHTVNEVHIEPAVVEVTGPRMLVASLQEVFTEPIDVSGLQRDASYEVILDLPRSVRQAHDDIRLRAQVTVVPELERRLLGSVPVHLWQAPEWRTIQESVEVTLEGPAASLAALDPTEVVAFVHIPDVPEKPRYEAPFGPREGVRLRVLHPAGDGVMVVKVLPARVEVVRG